MKYALPLLFSVLLPAMLSAQPVMDQGDAPQLDEIFPYVTGTYTPITISGPDATWDLSGIGTSAVTYLPCESPGATAYGNDFPAANLAMDAGNIITFLRTDASGVYVVGAYRHIGSMNILVHYADESLVLPFPCTYNTEYADTFAYNYTYPGGTVNGGGQGAYNADGFGTLILPYGTISNVLKISGADTTSESIPGSIYTTTRQMVYFYKPGVHYFLLNATHSTLTVNGENPQSGSGITYMAEEAFTAISEQAADAIGIEAWPMPAQDVLNVEYGLAGGHHVDISLFDATGRKVHAGQVNTTASGIQRATVNVQGWPAGIYLLRVTDDHGQRGTRRIVVQ